MEVEYQKGEVDLDNKMRRLKDLSAYSLTHDITYRREGVELLALAKLLGLTSERRFQKNPERLKFLAKETIEYHGQVENVQCENEEGEDSPVEAKSLDQLFQIGNCRPHDTTPLQGVFAESVAPFDRKVFAESVAPLAKKKRGSPLKKSLQLLYLVLLCHSRLHIVFW